MADLRKLAVKYNFKKAALDKTLRDRFVVDFVKNLFGAGYSDDLAFDRAVELATGLEKAKKTCAFDERRTVRLEEPRAGQCSPYGQETPTSTSEAVLHMRKPHALATCRFINAKCHICSKVGHIRKAYRGKGAASKASQRKGPPRRGAVHNIEDNDDLTDSSTPAHTHPHKAHATFTQSTLFHLG